MVKLTQEDTNGVHNTCMGVKVRIQVAFSKVCGYSPKQIRVNKANYRHERHFSQSAIIIMITIRVRSVRISEFIRQ